MERREIISILALVLLGIALTNCSGSADSPNRSPVQLVATPFAQIKGQGSEIVIDLGLTVVQPELVDTADNPFLGGWRLTRSDGTLLAGGKVEDVPSQRADNQTNARYLDQWTGSLQPGTYRLTWGAPHYGYTVDTFEIVIEAGDPKVENYASSLHPQLPADS